ncbi:ejaculatory bulb-specific protein 3-like [Cimex lectularius]|uniref:Chemosensory protein n=1 Tax=Cimex lectularius TaxID=79782 RepID=A0A8I6RY28_CIMLE|nr:ejaculatory bulb-specific protein 3-like [Cimex lectularius]
MDFKCSVFFCVVLCFVVVYGAETYSSALEDIDVDAVLKNQRLFKRYVDCLTNEGSCTPDQKDLKDVLPEILATDCAKCSKKLRALFEKVAKYTVDNKPEDFKKLQKLYDPDGVYKSRFGSTNKTTESPA